MIPTFKAKAYPASFRSLTKKQFDPTKDWYFYVPYINANGKPKQKRFKKNINESDNLEDRRQRLSYWLAATNELIKEGWNPITGKMPEYSAGSDLDNFTLSEALNFVLKEKTLDPKTRKGYQKAIDELMAAAERLHLHRLKPCEIRRRQILLMFSNWQDTEYTNNKGEKVKPSNKTYNKYFGFIRSLFTDLVIMEFIEFNILLRVPLKKVTGKKPFTQPEVHEKALIYDYLTSRDPEYRNFIVALHQTGARPFELLLVQIKHVKIQARVIEFQPENTKTEVMKRLPITDELYEILQSLNIDKYPKDYYVFGSPYPARQGYRGNGFYKKLMFCPNPVKIKVDTTNRRWKKYIKVGLGIDAAQYGVKGRGGNDRVRAKISPEAIRAQFGHADVETSKIYAFDMNDELRRQIIEQTPRFKE